MVTALFCGEKYEEHLSFQDWKNLIEEVIKDHAQVMKQGAFMVINISDILCFPDPDMPRYMANNISNKKVPVTQKDALEAKLKNRTRAYVCVREASYRTTGGAALGA